MSAPAPHRFELLDGLRGVAAIAVMLYHYTQHNGLHWARGAWVAVDLFFTLSGFVLAYTYTRKILAGMTWRQFAQLRLLRLAPLYCAGLMLGLLAAELAPGRQAGAPGSGQVFMAAVLGALGLPYFHGNDWPMGAATVHGAIFPLNDPAWSLFFELAVNAVFFWWLQRFRQLPGKLPVLAAFVVYFICLAVLRNANPGWSGDTFAAGFPRVGAEFFLGALFFSLRLHERGWSPWLACVTAAIAMAALWGNLKIALVNCFVLLPAVVVLLAGVRAHSARLKRACQWLGDLSYPLYVLHIPLYRLAYALFGMERYSAALQTVLIGVPVIIVSVLMARADAWLRARIGAQLALRHA